MVNAFIDVSVTIFIPVVTMAGSFLVVIYIILWLYEAWDEIVNLMGSGE